jgi:hypothetical protein
MRTRADLSWLIRLDKPGRFLAPLSAGREGHGVYDGPDRRRRPFAIASPRQVADALSAGLVEPGAAGIVIAEAGRARLKRERAAPQRAFREQHAEMGMKPVIDPDGTIRALAANLAASPLAGYAKPAAGRPALIEPVHAAAGEKLRADYDASALRSPVTSDWTRPPLGRTGRGPRDPAAVPDRMADARTRVMDALAAAGPGLDRLLVNVCLRETGMGAAEREMGWPARSGVHALRLALERLAVHYRMKTPGKAADPF